MERSLRRCWFAALGAAAVAISACSSACPHTDLDLTLHGGFGYVMNPDLTVEAGFMKSWHETDPMGCQVDQLGVDLKIDDGQILSPANWPLSIPVKDAVVSFEGADTGAVTVTGVLAGPLKQLTTGTAATSMAAVAGAGPSAQKLPMPRLGDDDWRDLFWVPHTRMNFWNKAIDPMWRTNAASGRVVLGAGTLSAGIPSDGAAVNGLWEFKTKRGVVSHQQAITDRLHFRTRVRGSTVVINLTVGSVTTKIEVAPIDNRKTVGIFLVGRHTGSQMPPALNGPLDHFCTFYRLLADPPSVDDRLIPYFVGNGNATGGTNPPNGQPTPGLFCPGDWP